MIYEKITQKNSPHKKGYLINELKNLLLGAQNPDIVSVWVVDMRHPTHFTFHQLQ